MLSSAGSLRSVGAHQGPAEGGQKWEAPPVGAAVVRWREGRGGGKANLDARFVDAEVLALDGHELAALGRARAREHLREGRGVSD